MTITETTAKFCSKGGTEYYLTVTKSLLLRMNLKKIYQNLFLLNFLIAGLTFESYSQCSFIGGAIYSAGSSAGCACTWTSDGITYCSWGNCNQTNQIECTSLTDCNGTWTSGVGNAGLIICGVNLPGQMVAFYGDSEESDLVNLFWITATELDNDHFNLYHSMNINNFEFMSSIPGAGTTSEENRYHFYHHNPEPGIHYYRLSQVDINGVEEFSDIISVTHNVNDNGGDFTQLYPNPVIDFCNVTYRGNNYSSPIQIKIYSMNGEQVYHSEVDNFNNSTGISIPVENLFNGVYIIELSQDGISERQRINVMK